MKYKKIKIGGVWVDVKYISGQEHFPDGESGLALFNQHLIKIDDSMKKEEQESTLIHEILEFINKMWELGLDHKTICCLEVSLYQVLKDNFKVTTNSHNKKRDEKMDKSGG